MADTLDLDKFKRNLNECNELERKQKQLEHEDKVWHLVYGAIVASLVKEYYEKEWGQVDEKAMEGIITKAKAIADLHNRVL